MKASEAGNGQLRLPSEAPRYVMFVEGQDGTFNIFEDDLVSLKKYRPKKGERTSIHRAYVRRAS